MHNKFKYNYVKESELDILICMAAVSQQTKYLKGKSNGASDFKMQGMEICRIVTTSFFLISVLHKFNNWKSVRGSLPKPNPLFNSHMEFIYFYITCISSIMLEIIGV